MISVPEPEHASAAAVAGLAREVDELRRVLDPLRELPAQVDEVTELLTQALDDLATSSRRTKPVTAPSWLDLPADDPDAARELLGELVAWVRAVYLRYADGVASLTACWLWHPGVVEELLWLQRAWQAAYREPGASVQLAGDWHDRLRPGVARRVRTALGTCDVSEHCDPPPRFVVPLGEEFTTPIADWWACRREEPAPDPTPGQLAAADEHSASLRSEAIRPKSGRYRR